MLRSSVTRRREQHEEADRVGDEARQDQQQAAREHECAVEQIVGRHATRIQLLRMRCTTPKPS